VTSDPDGTLVPAGTAIDVADALEALAEVSPPRVRTLEEDVGTATSRLIGWAVLQGSSPASTAGLPVR
jgi:hypothetical protein